MNVKEKSISGVKWMVGKNVLQKVISVSTFMILARILQPSAFGLFAMAFIVIDGFFLFNSFGIDTALIQRREQIGLASHTAFYLSVVAGFVVFFILQLLAPLLTEAFDNKEIQPVLQALGWVFIFGSFRRVPYTLLGKELRYREVTIIEMLGTVTNSFFAVTLAYYGFGVWSLVYAYLAKQLVEVSLAWKTARYFPKWQFNFQIAKDLFHFGKYLFGTTIIWFLVARVDHFVIARSLGAAFLGYYALAFNITDFTSQYFVRMVSRVLFPAYSKLNNDINLIQRGFFKTIHFVAIVCVPIGSLLCLLGPEFVRVMYGSRWTPVIIPMQILAFRSIYTPLFGSINPIFLACGKPEYAFRLNLLLFLVKLPLLILMTVYWGIVGTAASLVIAGFLITPYYIKLSKQVVAFRLRDIGKKLRVPVLSSLTMIAVVLIIRVFLPTNPISFVSRLFVLLSMVIPAGVTYLTAFWFLDKETILELKRMLFGSPRSPEKEKTVFIHQGSVTPRVPISVIICTKDRAVSLQQTLNCFHRQLLPHEQYEIIVVDNGSRDKTRAIMEDFAKSSPVHVENLYCAQKGKSRALNLAIAKARGDILVFTDDDVLLPEDWLVQIQNVFEISPFDAVQGKVILSLPPQVPNWLHDRVMGYLSQVNYGNQLAPYESYLVGCNLSIRKNVFLRCGGFNHRLGPGTAGANEEVELGIRMRKNGYKIFYAPQIYLYHKFSMERLRRTYFRKRSYLQGRSDAVMHGINRSWNHFLIWSTKDVLSEVNKYLKIKWAKTADESELAFLEFRIFKRLGFLKQGILEKMGVR